MAETKLHDPGIPWEPMQLPSKMWHFELAGLTWLHNHESFERSVLSTFRMEDGLKEALAQRLWKQNFILAIECIDKLESGWGTAYYTLNDWLLMSYMEKSESRVMFVRRPAASDVWVDIIDDVMNLDIPGSKEIYLTVTVGRYVLTYSDCSDQIGHNDFSVRLGRRLRFFLPVFVSEAICIFVCPASHIYLNYAMAEKTKRVELLRLKEVAS